MRDSELQQELYEDAFDAVFNAVRETKDRDKVESLAVAEFARNSRHAENWRVKAVSFDLPRLQWQVYVVPLSKPIVFAIDIEDVS